MKRFPVSGLLFWLAILVLFSWMYHPTLLWMYGRFIQADTYYSHGFLVPFVTAFLIWQRREALAQIPVGYSWWGFSMIAIALLVHFVSSLLYVFFPSGLSILLLVFGMSLFVFGKPLTKELLFPISFMAFMFPLPSSAINWVGIPLKSTVAYLGARWVNALGIPVHQSGFYLDTAKGSLLIDDPCSGIRSLIAFMALGALAGYIGKESYRVRVLIFSASVLVALISNVLRVSFLIVVANYCGSGAASPDTRLHDISGYVFFAIGSIILFGLSRSRLWGK